MRETDGQKTNDVGPYQSIPAGRSYERFLKIINITITNYCARTNASSKSTGIKKKQRKKVEKMQKERRNHSCGCESTLDRVFGGDFLVCTCVCVFTEKRERLYLYYSYGLFVIIIGY